MKLGLDIGSKNIYFALLNNDIVDRGIMSHNGDIKGILKKILSDLDKKHDLENINTIGITGKIDIPGLKSIDPILASIEANRYLKTGCKNILSIGCESFYLIFLDDDYNYIEHSINSDCASGTGSFIDQQAERLGLTTEELAYKAYEFKSKSPSIATRCAVFAKSDIIHAQAKGYSKEAIASGICEGVTRSILSNVIKGRLLKGDVLLTGGVSQNKKIVSDISKNINTNIKVINESIYFNAIGAALLAGDKINLDNILDNKNKRAVRESLIIKLTNYPDFYKDKFYVEDDIEITLYNDIVKENYNIYIGIDIGSTSTKLVIIDDKKNIIMGLYTKTKGIPVEAVSKLLKKIENIFNHTNINILGVSTTGSGRLIVKDIISADLAINEISAHAKGAVFLDPGVDTIIEIGGQDSKFTLLKDGEVVNSTLNYVCAAGTGSFIEEQAKRLDMSLDDISELALGQRAPYTSDRCTVYMERDLNIFLQEGWSKNEIIASVLFSVRDNYLSKVVGKSPIGNRVYFQGATARNKALVAVFENELKKPIFVSKYCHLTGALGAAIAVSEKIKSNTNFIGINFKYKLLNETCKLCHNRCDLRVYDLGDKKVAWGLKCGRDYENKKVLKIEDISLLEKRYFTNFYTEEKKFKNSIKIGIPLTLYMIEYFPLFHDFFQSLNINVILDKGSENTLQEGRVILNSDFCSPMVIAHGLVKSLLEKDVDYIFLPAIMNEQSYMDKLEYEEKYLDKIGDAYFCYYSQYASTVVDNLTILDLKNKLISPKIKFNNRPLDKISEDLAVYLSEMLNIDKEKLKKAFLLSYDNFINKKRKWIKEGSKILTDNGDKIKIMLLGRPYSIFNNLINLGIPKKIESYGFDLIYQSMFDFKNNEVAPDSYLKKMHWFYGQQIMLALNVIAENKNIYPVFLTCFRCSPDSYLISYFKSVMDKLEKPYLIIQLDEHTSDVGYQTRIEAAVESFKNHFNKKINGISAPQRHYRNDIIEIDSTILIPYLSPVISNLQVNVFNIYGYKAELLKLEKNMINLGYRYASGGECMPNVAIIGTIIDKIKNKKLNPEKTIVYMPTACIGCNFNQFTVLIDIACENAGIKGLKIANPNAARSVPYLPKELNNNLLLVNILGSILYKLYFRFHPYEIKTGETDKVLKDSIDLLNEYIRDDKSLLGASNAIRDMFNNIKIKQENKPRIGILGDLYVKYNSVLNDDIYSLIEELGGEILIPSFTDTVANIIDGDIRETGLDRKYLRGLNIFEKRFENIFTGLIDYAFEPPVDECIRLMHEFGINHYIPGETTINISRMLYYIKHKVVDAVVHLNPVFCCPGVVSSSIFRKIQKEFNIPIIDLFYDGSNKPNKIIIPHMYYLNEKKKNSLIKNQ